MFWNCQGIRPKHKELELYLTENSIDIIALNERSLTKGILSKYQVMILYEKITQLA